VTSSLSQHLASYPCTAAGSRALAGHLRDDHGKTLYTSPCAGHAAHSAMHAAAYEAGQSQPPPARDPPARPHPAHGPDATYRCRCGEIVPGSEIGVTEQARDWFYAPAGRRQARVTTYRRLRGYRHHNSATARALARHLRSEGFQSVDIDPGDPGAAVLIAAQVRDRGPDVRSGLALGLVNTGRGDHWTAATVRLGPSEPWGKGLAAQRGAHEPYSLGGGSQPETLLAVGGEYPVDSVRGHQLGEFPAAGAISPASTLDTAVRVIPGHRCQRRRMAAQHLILPALRR
jgi:hypothetical protein